MNPITDGPLFALVQSTVKPEMQGRVMSLIIQRCHSHVTAQFNGGRPGFRCDRDPYLVLVRRLSLSPDGSGSLLHPRDYERGK